MALQKQNSAGRWVAVSDPEYIVGQILKRESWYAPRVGREPMTTPEQVLAHIAGHEMTYGTDWYDVIRSEPAPPTEHTVTVRADCGHQVSAEMRMSTSTGTSCPDCYDRMS